MDAAAKAGPQRYDRKNPFLAEIIGHEHLTKPGSNKDTRHFVLSLKGSGLTYTPGDSLAVFARRWVSSAATRPGISPAVNDCSAMTDVK